MNVSERLDLTSLDGCFQTTQLNFINMDVSERPDLTLLVWMFPNAIKGIQIYLLGYIMNVSKVFQIGYI